jgi:hypothetical protein
MQAHLPALPRPQLRQADGGDHVPPTAAIAGLEPAPRKLQIPHRPLTVPAPGHTWTCWICGGGVSLETCKTDEHGKAVHEECYVARMALERASAQWVSQKERDKREAASASR